jgi:hypothetical protein
MPARATMSVMAWVAAVSAGLTMIASSHEVLHLVDLRADVGLRVLELEVDVLHGRRVRAHGLADVG